MTEWQFGDVLKYGEPYPDWRVMVIRDGDAWFAFVILVQPVGLRGLMSYAPGYTHRYAFTAAGRRVWLRVDG